MNMFKLIRIHLRGFHSYRSSCHKTIMHSSTTQLSHPCHA